MKYTEDKFRSWTTYLTWSHNPMYILWRTRGQGPLSGETEIVQSVLLGVVVKS